MSGFPALQPLALAAQQQKQAEWRGIRGTCCCNSAAKLNSAAAAAAAAPLAEAAQLRQMALEKIMIHNYLDCRMQNYNAGRSASQRFKGRNRADSR